MPERRANFDTAVVNLDRAVFHAYEDSGRLRSEVDRLQHLYQAATAANNPWAFSWPGDLADCPAPEGS